MLDCYCHSNPKKTWNQGCLHRCSCVCYCRVSPQGCSTEEWIQVLGASKARQPQHSSLSSAPLGPCPLPSSENTFLMLDYLSQNLARGAVILGAYWCRCEFFPQGFLRVQTQFLGPYLPIQLIRCKLKWVLAGLKQVFQLHGWTERHLNACLNDLWNWGLEPSQVLLSVKEESTNDMRS